MVPARLRPRALPQPQRRRPSLQSDHPYFRRRAAARGGRKEQRASKQISHPPLVCLHQMLLYVSELHLSAFFFPFSCPPSFAARKQACRLQGTIDTSRSSRLVSVLPESSYAFVHTALRICDSNCAYNHSLAPSVNRSRRWSSVPSGYVHRMAFGCKVPPLSHPRSANTLPSWMLNVTAARGAVIENGERNIYHSFRSHEW